MSRSPQDAFGVLPGSGEPRIIQEARIALVEHSIREVDGQWLDVVTANMLCTVWDGLNKVNREEFGKLSLMGMVKVGWACVQPRGET